MAPWHGCVNVGLIFNNSDLFCYFTSQPFPDFNNHLVAIQVVCLHVTLEQIAWMFNYPFSRSIALPTWSLIWCSLSKLFWNAVFDSPTSLNLNISFFMSP